MKTTKKLLFLAMLGLPFGTQAADTFSVNLTSEGKTVTETFANIDELLDATEGDGFDRYIDEYTITSAATATADIRGVTASSHYDAGSSRLVFTVDFPGEEKDYEKFFDGGSRDASEKQFRDFLRENGDGILTRMFHEMVASTGIDPVGGNPNSLTYSNATDDFNAAMETDPGRGEGEDAKQSKVTGGVEFGHFTVDGNEQNIFNIPLSYTYYFDKPGYYAKFSGPISYVETNGSKAYKGSVGASLHVPVRENWSLTPAVRIGGVASEDMGAAAIVGGVSLTSVYETKLGRADLKIANMASTLQTSSLESEDYQIDYDLSNQILKNAVSAKFPTSVTLLDKPLDLEATFANTKVLGDEVYIGNYNDLALSLGSASKTGNARLDDMRLGITYTQGDHDYKGVKLNFGYTF